MKQKTYGKYRDIYFAYINGSTTEQLSQKYNLSQTTINSAIKHVQEEMNSPKENMYLFIRKNEPEGYTKIYQVLRRNGCETLEQLKNLDVKKMHKFKGCGEKTIIRTERLINLLKQVH